MDINRKENTDFIYDPTLASSKQKTRMDQKSYFSLEKSHDLTSLKLRRRKQRQILENEKRHALVDGLRELLCTDETTRKNPSLKSLKRKTEELLKNKKRQEEIDKKRQEEIDKKRQEEIDKKRQEEIDKKRQEEIDAKNTILENAPLVENNVTEKNAIVPMDKALFFDIKYSIEMNDLSLHPVEAKYPMKIAGFIPDSAVYDLEKGHKIRSRFPGYKLVLSVEKQDSSSHLVKCIHTRSYVFNSTFYAKEVHFHIYQKKNVFQEDGERYAERPDYPCFFLVKGQELCGQTITQVTDDENEYGFYREIKTADPVYGKIFFFNSVTYKILYRKELIEADLSIVGSKEEA